MNAPSRYITAIETCGFSGFTNNSIWFTPFGGGSEDVNEQLFTDAREAMMCAQGLLSVGCSMAKKRSPALAAELQALAAAVPRIEFHDTPGSLIALGWFRITFDAPGATKEALAACENALAQSRAPVLMAECPEGQPLLSFAQGLDVKPPSEFIEQAIHSTNMVARQFFAQQLDLGSAEIIRLESADGSKRLIASMSSTSTSRDPLQALNTYAKFAQSCIQAQHAHPQSAERDAFYGRLAQSLGAGDGELASREPIQLPIASFFPAPSNLFVTTVGNLPTEGFDQFARSFLQGLSQRFGAIAASTKGLHGEMAERSLTIEEIAELQPVFAKLSPKAPEAPKPSAQPQGPSTPTT